MNENEVWKPYPEFSFIEGSSLGRVRTRDRMVSNGKGTRLEKGRILKQRLTKNGYMDVEFRANGRTVNRLVHRIIASCFIPNPDNLPEVNHINCIRDDDRLTNLEWCDTSYNRRYREKYGISQTEAIGQPVYAINLATSKVSRFQSQREASRVLGVNNSHISSVIAGKRKTAGDYWFTEDDGNGIEIDKDKLHENTTGKTSKRPVLAINLSTLEISRFRSQCETSRVLGVDRPSVTMVIAGKRKTAGGYWFTEANDRAVENTRNKFGNVVADQVEELMNEKEIQLA